MFCMCVVCVCVLIQYTAVLARRKQHSDEPQASNKARKLGKASYVTSICGIVVTAIIVFIALIILFTVSCQITKFCRLKLLLHNQF